MKIKLTITQEVYIDLESRPFENWPYEAKAMARSLLANPRLQREFLAQLPAIRKSWLAARIERLSEGLVLETLI